VIAGERAEEQTRELAAEHALEAVARRRPGLGEALEGGEVLEQQRLPAR
jgi:hypothetical protein